jgi:hypothetical protein
MDPRSARSRKAFRGHSKAEAKPQRVSVKPQAAVILNLVPFLFLILILDVFEGFFEGEKENEDEKEALT